MQDADRFEFIVIGKNTEQMGSIISHIADQIKLHGSWDAYCQWQEKEKADNSYICETTNSRDEKTDHDISSLGTS